MTTRKEDIWNCSQCGQFQGRHDMWFDGLCGDCVHENEENKIMEKREELLTALKNIKKAREKSIAKFKEDMAKSTNLIQLLTWNTKPIIKDEVWIMTSQTLINNLESDESVTFDDIKAKILNSILEKSYSIVQSGSTFIRKEVENIELEVMNELYSVVRY